LSADKSLAPFRILYLEESFDFPVTLESEGEPKIVRTGGKIDRIDIADGFVRIVDYKTGSVADRINSVEDLFGDDRNKDNDAWLQTLLYCEAYLAKSPEAKLRPSVYKVKRLTEDSENDKLRIRTGPRTDIEIDDYHSVREDFIRNLKETIATIFSTDVEFSMTTDLRGKCSYCPYRGLCGR
jgi:hypothetical protein